LTTATWTSPDWAGSAGFTRTDRGVFGFGSLTHGGQLMQTTEDEPAGLSDDAPMTLTEFRDSIRRVLGADLPLGDVTRLSRYGFQARQAERYRDGRVLLAGDAAHQFPAMGIGINFGMLDAVNLAWKLAAVIGGWAPAGLLDTYHSERHFAGARALLHTQAQVALRRGQDPVRRSWVTPLAASRARRDCTGAASALHIRPIDTASCALDLSISCCSAALLVRSAW
jgi:2-polyprenyl-6-methoxyphenol hydroxylase-like FAD-dependent oxidoreductase